jgi:hypothetical protein
VFIITGVGFFAAARKLFSSAVPGQTVPTAMENVEWITNSK